MQSMARNEQAVARTHLLVERKSGVAGAGRIANGATEAVNR